MRYQVNDIFILEMQNMNNPNFPTKEVVKVTAVDANKGVYVIHTQSGSDIEVKESDIQSHILDINMTEHLLLSLGFSEDKTSKYAIFNDKCFKKKLIANGVGFVLVIVKTDNGYNLVYSNNGQTHLQPIGAYCDLQKHFRTLFGYELPFCLSRLASSMGYVAKDPCFTLFDQLFDISIELRHAEDRLRCCNPNEEERLQKECDVLKTRLLALCKQISEMYKQATVKTECLEALHQQMVIEHQRYFGVI